MTSSFSEHSRALVFPHVKEKPTNKKQNTHKVKQKMYTKPKHHRKYKG